MTLATDAAWNAAAIAPVIMPVNLIELQFTTGTLRVTNWPLDLVTLGQTWKGIGTVAEVGALKESEDGNYQKTTLALSQVQSSQLALALGSPETYQGRSARIWQALGDAASQLILAAPILRFAGAMDLVRITRDKDSNIGRIELDCNAGAYDLRTNPTALRLNQPQHSVRKPGETGFRYVNDLIARPQVWLSKTAQMGINA